MPPFTVVLVHGGPGAAGGMAGLARLLGERRGVVEALQTRSTVADQVSELAETIEREAETPSVVIGWSWGAWLAYLTAATHPALVSKLVLVGSGPFEAEYAGVIMQTRLARLIEPDRTRALALIRELNDRSRAAPAGGMAELGALLESVDAYEPLDAEPEPIDVRQDIYEGVWPEAEEMRRSGELLRLGQDIRRPVIAIHGDHDPHPARGVEEPLSKVIRDFRFVLLERCGHTLWKERYARDAFLQVIGDELERS